MRHRDCHGLGRDRALFRFSDTWQLVINTGTTIVTFLMVFLIQNTQNRDSAAIQLKLDELIRSKKGAHNALIDSPAFTGGVLSEFKLRLSRVFLTLSSHVASDDLFGNSHRGHEIAL